jgi:hypothetical protein
LFPSMGSQPVLKKNRRIKIRDWEDNFIIYSMLKWELVSN